MLKIKINRLLAESVEAEGIIEKILNSFEPKDTLNPKIFVEKRMREEIRDMLLRVADVFFEFLSVDADCYQDLLLTGSNANYNWSEFSDVDLHLVIPFEELGNYDTIENLFKTKKTLWNKEHDLKLGVHEIEMYVQSEVETDMVSGGVYSVLYDRWIVEPERLDYDIDVDMILSHYRRFKPQIKKIISLYKLGKYAEALSMIQQLWGILKDFRQTSLDNEGEFSAGNLAYKLLRRTGDLDKLDKVEKLATNKNLSMPQLTYVDYSPKDGKNKTLKYGRTTVDRGRDKEREGGGSSKVNYIIYGQPFTSLRHAEDVLGIPKSTIQYRVKNNDDPKYRHYIEVRK